MSAVLSPCGTWRYVLERTVNDRGLTYLFAGVNPSKADALKNDHTSSKWIGFVERWGGWRYLAINPFAFRATDVRELQHAADPIGPDNDLHIERAIRQADVLVPCWGNRQKLPEPLRPRLDAVLAMLVASGKPVMCFGLTAGGDPLHPLTLSYKTPLVPLAAADLI